MSVKPHQISITNTTRRSTKRNAGTASAKGYVYCCFEEFACIDPESGCDDDADATCATGAPIARRRANEPPRRRIEQSRGLRMLVDLATGEVSSSKIRTSIFTSRFGCS